MVIIKDVAEYIVPIIALLLSIYSAIKSNKVTELERKINEYDLKLKEYELEKIEKEKNVVSRAQIDARIINVSKNAYKMKVWNSGTERAFDINYDIPPQYEIILLKDVLPFEYLDPGESFEGKVVVHMASSSKYEVVTTWKDEDGTEYSTTKMRSL